MNSPVAPVKVRVPVTVKALLAGLLLAAPASAQVDRPEYLQALAAGYKAAFLCSDDRG